MSRRSLLLVLACAVAAVGGAGLARMLSQNEPALQGGTWLPQPRALGAFALEDTQGRPFGPGELAGRPSLLFTGYTYCPDVCPTTLSVLRDVLRDPPLPGLRLLFLTVDPERDDGPRLHDYLAAFDASFVGLRAPEPALSPFLRSLGALAVRQPQPGGGYLVDHTATLYLLDAQGRIAAVFSPPFAAASLRSDLARIAASGRLR